MQVVVNDLLKGWLSRGNNTFEIAVGIQVDIGCNAPGQINLVRVNEPPLQQAERFQIGVDSAGGERRNSPKAPVINPRA